MHGNGANRKQERYLLLGTFSKFYKYWHSIISISIQSLHTHAHKFQKLTLYTVPPAASICCFKWSLKNGTAENMVFLLFKSNPLLLTFYVMDEIVEKSERIFKCDEMFRAILNECKVPNTYLPFVGSVCRCLNWNCAGEQETFIFQYIRLSNWTKNIIQIDLFEITAETFH